LSADEAFWKDFQEKFLDRVYYADQYKYMDFGRGKLAELTFYAKQSQNKWLIAESIAEILAKLECHIYGEKYDAIAITPWSIKRQNQLLWALKKELQVFKLPFINIIKYSESWIFIPQKSLKSRSERIENAKNTIFIDDANTWNYKKVLLIDDFVWSGATLNETARKLKDEWVQEVYGFAFVGNTNLSYDVINEI
jgi:predicted amidophosphoribosyltransferase